MWRAFEYEEEDDLPQPTIPTGAEVLPDGTMLELVWDGTPKLLVWNRKKTHIAESFAHDGQVLVPASIDSSTAQAIRLPSHAVLSFGSTRALFDAICDAAGHYFGLTDQDLRAISYWALSSWFPELLPILTTLIITGRSPVQARALLRFLACVCRHGVLLSELDPAGFLALPRQLRLTLLIDQSRLSRRMGGLLRATSARGAYVTRAGKFFELFCVKAIYCADKGLDLGPGEGALRIAVGPGQFNSAVFDDTVARKIAADLQPKLLGFRLKNYKTVQKSDFDVPAFSAGVRELAQSLAATVAGDADLVSEITPLLAPRDKDARARWTTLPEFGIISALLACVHEGEASQIRVNALTDDVNTILRAGGEFATFSPEEVGHKLSGLGLFTSRTSRGKVIRITREISRRVHELKRSYGVTTSPASFPGCPDCEQPEVSDIKAVV